MHTVKWFQVLLSNTNNSFWYQPFVYPQLNDFKYSKWLNNSIWPIDRTLTGTTTLGQSGLGSNGNEEVLHISQSSKTGASPSDGLISYPGHLLGWVSYSSAKMQSAYSTTSNNWAKIKNELLFKKNWLLFLIS